MSLIQGLVLGVVQGLTEFLPVSSSGHLIVIPHFFGWADQGLAFDTVLHLGTLLALLWYFGRDVLQLAVDSVKRGEQGAATRVFLVKMLVAIVPVLMLAAIFNRAIEDLTRNTHLVAIDLALWGILLWVADRYSTAKKVDHETIKTDVKDITWTQAMLVGLMQPISLLPGSSRSGVTITAGLFAGMPRRTAARFSFLISIPVTAIAGLHGVWEIVRKGSDSTEYAPLFVGFLASAVVGAWTIRFLLRYVTTHHYYAFAYYRVAFALLVLLAV